MPPFGGLQKSCQQSPMVVPLLGGRTVGMCGEYSTGVIGVAGCGYPQATTKSQGDAVPHLALNPDRWRSTFNRAECADLAESIGLTVEEVSAVVMSGASPTEQFVASCLYYLPAEFGDLFTVTPPAQLVVAA